jgi:beta-glucanase (GH16 family)
MRLLFNLTLLVALFGSASCNKKPIDDEVVLPTNITTQVQVLGAQVTVNVTASNANFYTVTFTQGGQSTVIESTDGFAQFTYAESGAYQIISRAHTSYTHFIEKTDVVDVEIISGGGGAPQTGYTTPLSYPGYTLVWSDEFNGTTLSSDWVYDIGTGSSGWGNNELQYYTNTNAIVSNGYLEIKAKAEPFNSQLYTSSRIKTQGKKSWKYGRIDIRAALPYGKGIWPALWMLGDNITTVGWPSCGEIDIVELIGGTGLNDRTIHGTVHWNQGGHVEYGNSYSLPNGSKFADKFHVFSIVWTENSIRWLVDDVQYSQVNITPAELAAFHANFFLIFNVAVGGNWPGSPDGTTVFPQSMYVDYVRVFQ